MSSTGTLKSCIAAAGTYCGIGLEIPIVPTAIAIMAVIIVRVLVWTKAKSIVWNLAVMSLCSVAAFVTVEGSELNTFRAFWIGVGYGAVGVGIVEIGKSAILSALKERFTNAAAVLFGIKTKD